MPFSGGFTPGPERTGGGDVGSAVPRLQRIFESIAARRGKAFDQTDASVVGAENMALARAIEFDLYGANIRFANEMNPVTSTVGGLLPRWEAALGAKPLPTDTQIQRQQRVATALLRFAQVNSIQAISDACAGVLGPIFVSLTLVTPQNAIVWWPGDVGVAAKITTVTGNQVTVTGISNNISTAAPAVPADAAGKTITLANCTNAGNNGTFLIQSRINSQSVVCINNGSPVASDNGIGGSSGAPTIAWTMTNQVRPFMSSTEMVLVQVNPSAVPGYLNPDGSPNAAFYAAANAINPILDWLLPADHVFAWYVASSHGGPGWYLDENNLDLEVFDS